jgi:HD-GYP domain-containing protein (c-di-GMP phosphodiesterase class II)
VNERVFIGALLHDAGALTQEEKIRIHDFEENNPEAHCIRGASLLEVSPLLARSAGIVRFHHRPWDQWGAGIDSEDVFESQLLYLADCLERSIKRNQYILHQDEELTSRIAAMAGSEIHPDVVDLFIQISKREEFWLDLVSPRLYSILLNAGPLRRSVIEIGEIFSIGAFFCSIIDFKSHFTATHSSGVAECTSVLSRLFGLTTNEVSLMELAGYFHDIGKLAVPNAILEKPGKLTKDEFAVMKKHTYFTYTVLTSIGGLDQIAEWAAFHHEKLDGTGYPFHVNGERLNTGARIMAVADIFTALAEDRPYRAGMQREDIERILKKMSKKNVIDKRIVDLLLDNYQEVLVQVKEKQSIAHEEYKRVVALSDMVKTH